MGTYCFGLRVSLLRLLDDPVLERSNLLDVGLLLGVGLFGCEVDLLLDTVGAQGALLLEAAGGDVVVASALGTETDVDGLHVGRGVPLAFEQGCLGDALLSRLDGGDEGAEAVDLDRVAL